MTKGTNSTINPYIQILCGILAIGVALYGAFLLQVKNNLQLFLIAILFIFGITSLSPLWGGSININYKYLSAKRAYALFIILIGWSFKLLTPIPTESSLKIQIIDLQGKSILAHEKQVIKIRIGKNSKAYDLDSDSEILLPLSTNIDSVQIEILTNDWQLEKLGKSAFFKIPSSEILTLRLEPAPNRCCIKGTVHFEFDTQNTLSNIIVQAAGVKTQTDSQGNYHLELPKNNQLDDLKIQAFNDTYSGSIICNTATPCDILLRKRNK
ncbi:hypothetical protein ABID42_004705 [Arcicella rosea]|uniref:hypothetical protein n=1 Tax=Arcicella rosea TaxID=502909 RepID=UPI00345C7C5A